MILIIGCGSVRIADGNDSSCRCDDLSAIRKDDPTLTDLIGAQELDNDTAKSGLDTSEAG